MESKNDGDVHLAKGLACVDCHRNGLDHAMARGNEDETAYAGKKGISTLSCRGCHESGRLGAPRPVHFGLPASHLKKLTCTACHSGLLPGAQPRSVRTARAHRLGTPSMHRREDVPPFIVEPVFLRQADSKIAPHRMMWPSFWGRVKGDKVTPLAPGVVGEAIGMKEAKPEEWKPLTEEQIAKALKALSAKKDDAGEAVYISGGSLYRLMADGKLSGSGHAAAAPYSWPIAHDVRPAAQSLGSRGCTDCHAKKAAFFFASVAPQSPAKIGRPTVQVMYEFQGQKLKDLQAWNTSIRHRRAWTIVNLVAVGILACIFVNFSVMGLSAIFRATFVRRPRRGE
jgi:cytochrome c5